MKRILMLAGCLLSVVAGLHAWQPEISVAGFFPVENSGRQVYDFNPGWRYYRGDVAQGGSLELDDSAWEVVSVPHTVQLMPAEGSGSRNYQGKAWYRKHFVVDPALKGQRVQLYFEAVMGRADVWVNGRHVLQHVGGYLPFAVVLSDCGVEAGDSCLVAVCADNSDDKSYPPGKTQYTLGHDFSSRYKICFRFSS